MEKIQLALEKARAARTATREAASPAPSPAPAAAPPSGEPVLPPRRTRVVPVSTETLARNRIVTSSGAVSPAADAFRVLRTQLLSRLETLNGRAIAVCAATAGAGKTFVAVNLAISIARHLHLTALLVDLDLRRPSVHRYFDLQPEVGLSDYLLGTRQLEDCLVNPGIERLVLLPQVHSLEHSSELLALPRMAELVGQLKARYHDRVVILDCPPLLATDDAIHATGYADGCLLVVAEGSTTKDDLLRSAELIGEEKYLGSVLNNVRWSAIPTYGYQH